MEPISDEDDLYRRLAPLQVNDDGTVNSAAYKRDGKPDNSISMDLARLTTPRASLGDRPNSKYGLGMLLAAIPYSMQFTARHDPVAGDWAHSLVEGANDKTKCRALAKATSLMPTLQQSGPED